MSTTIYRTRNPFTGATEFEQRTGPLTSWAGYVRAGFSDGRSRVIGWSNADTEAAALAEVTRGTMAGLEYAVVPAIPTTAGERDAYLTRRALLDPTAGERAKWATTLTMAAVDYLRTPHDHPDSRIAKEHVADMVDQAMHFLGADHLDRQYYRQVAGRISTVADVAARWFLLVERKLDARSAEGIEAEVTCYLAKRDALIGRLEVATLAALALTGERL